MDAWCKMQRNEAAFLECYSAPAVELTVALKHILKPFKIEALFSLAFSMGESSLFFEGRSRGNLGVAGWLRLA